MDSFLANWNTLFLYGGRMKRRIVLRWLYLDYSMSVIVGSHGDNAKTYMENSVYQGATHISSIRPLFSADIDVYISWTYLSVNFAWVKSTITIRI